MKGLNLTSIKESAIDETRCCRGHDNKNMLLDDESTKQEEQLTIIYMITIFLIIETTTAYKIEVIHVYLNICHAKFFFVFKGIGSRHELVLLVCQ